MSFYEHYKRSIAKTLTYRALIVFASFLVFYRLLEDTWAAIENSLAWNIIGTVLYFLHERLWNLTRWGKHSAPNSRHKGKV